jgi:hypothetical protein
MAKFLLFGEGLPLVFDFGCLVTPLLADDLRYLWIGETRVLSDHLSLMMLAVKDEC